MHLAEQPSKKEPREVVTEQDIDDQSLASEIRPRSGSVSERGRSSKPVPLEKSVLSRLVVLTPHVALILVPLGFLILAGYIWRLRGQATSTTGENVIIVVGVASTLWPIAFAAVVGPTLRTMALYNAEHGVTLRVLEMLSSSQTLVGTIRACINFHFFSIWTLVLLVVWSLSPAGGQAVLRSITVDQLTMNTTHPLVYYPAKEVGVPFDSLMWGSASSGFNGHAGGVIRMMFGAVISAPNAAAILANGSSPDFEKAVDRLGGTAKVISASRTDIWGNVRMPYLEKLPSYNPEKPHEWVDVPTDEVPVYESLVGIPVRGIPSGDVGNLTFVVSAAYTTLKCSPWYNTSAWEKELYEGVGKTQPNSTMTSSVSMTSLDSPFANVSTLTFGTLHNITVCPINTTHIDAEVECVRALAHHEVTCSTKRARHSESFPITISEESFKSDVSGRASLQLFESIPKIIPSFHAGDQSPLEGYLADPLSEGIAAAKVITDEYTSLPPGIFEARLTVILNTVLRMSYGSSVILGAAGADFTNETGTLVDGDLVKYGNTSSLWSIYSPPSYHIHIGWMVLYMLSNVVLVLCVLAIVFLRLRIRAPDVLGSVTAHARDSPYVRKAAGGSAMDGIELANALGAVRVRIGDVRPDEAVGQIAFAGEETVRKRSMPPGRLYM